MLSKHFSEAIFSSVVKKLVSKDGTKFPDVDRVPSGDRPSTFIHELSSRPNLGRPFICFIRKFNDWKFTCRARILTTLTHLTAWRNLIQQNHTQRAALIFAYSFHRTQHQFSFQSSKPLPFPDLFGRRRKCGRCQPIVARRQNEGMNGRRRVHSPSRPICYTPHECSLQQHRTANVYMYKNTRMWVYLFDLKTHQAEHAGDNRCDGKHRYEQPDDDLSILCLPAHSHIRTRTLARPFPQPATLCTENRFHFSYFSSARVVCGGKQFLEEFEKKNRNMPLFSRKSFVIETEQQQQRFAQFKAGASLIWSAAVGLNLRSRAGNEIVCSFWICLPGAGWPSSHVHVCAPGAKKLWLLRLRARRCFLFSVNVKHLH